ncbi:flagellar biosynthesis protein FlhF [Pontibacillus sp. ALD_SL1]|uniref:flagellar biosynthesis protein FlhF n=1 Tax=Pontibacillus sp. ALD_SL1 TaxID=2777185 RepID=UPI001F6121FF|nr:flagellar biosynthesis protein FlhF [Pontibacillus sp. ALD_SL1]
MIKEYRGRKFNVLMEDIKKDFGDNFTLIEEKEVRKKPWIWMKEHQVKVKIIEEPFEKASKKQKLLDLLNQQDYQSRDGKEDYVQVKNIEQTMNNMLETMKTIQVGQQKTASYLGEEHERVLKEYYEKLIHSDVNETLAKKIISESRMRLSESQMSSHQDVEKEVLKSIASKVKVTDEGDLLRSNIIALIGPTGVGKTTTIAKLAGYFQTKEEKVGLITTDVYRIAAVDQLRIYAEILEAPFRSVREPEELKEVTLKMIEEYNLDRVLIDTVGRSPMDTQSIYDLQEYLDATDPDHIGLVLSSTQKNRDIEKILNNFQHIPLSSLFFTKLDETLQHGSMLNAVHGNDIPISYVTNGQNVPNDIFKASQDGVARKILNGVDDFGSSIVSTNINE